VLRLLRRKAAVFAAVAGKASSVDTEAFTGQLMAMNLGESGGSTSSMWIRSWPSIVPAAKSVRWCLGSTPHGRTQARLAVCPPGGPLMFATRAGRLDVAHMLQAVPDTAESVVG
jgi:hypothetical protein